MSPKENGMRLLYSAQRDSRIDKIPRIGVGSTGERYGLEVRTPLTTMKVPVYRRKFTRLTEQGRALSCDFTFYVTGKALTVTSMKWALADSQGAKRKEIPADGDACELIVGILREFAERHKAASIYASRDHIPSALLLRLGFTEISSHDFLQLDVSKPQQKH